MVEKSSDENPNREFEKIIGAYSDEELKKVLIKRNQYQKEAAQYAIGEAIRRGLIYSEQDLFAAEFNPKPEKFSIFSTIGNEKTKAKYRKSITRFLIVVGIIPVVWGSIDIFYQQSLQGILMFVFGATWSIVSYRLMRSVNIKLVYFMLFLLFVSVVYLVHFFVSTRSVNTMDIVVATVSTGLIFYLIGFLSKLGD